jgi:hypothetical protein
MNIVIPKLQLEAFVEQVASSFRNAGIEFDAENVETEVLNIFQTRIVDFADAGESVILYSPVNFEHTGKFLDGLSKIVNFVDTEKSTKQRLEQLYAAHYHASVSDTILTRMEKLVDYQRSCSNSRKN